MKKITILLFALCINFAGNAQVVSTIAGSTQGFADATGSAAKFDEFGGICTDANGNLYVSDSGNNKIRKITPEGVVTTFAGSTQGYADGTGTAAKFYYSGGICTDAGGNIYVADSQNNKIRKITSAGVVTTLAGSTQGFADGTGTAAKFDSPSGICVDNSGNVYVTDFYNNRIRKITQAGVVTTLAGISAYGFADGTGTAARFYNPTGICIDAGGNMYVADTYNRKIRKVTPAGVVTTVAGSTSGYADGTGSAAQFSYPVGVCADTAGNLYVADGANNRVRKITSAGVVTTLAGSTQGFGDGTGTAAKFDYPIAICISASGDLFVADYFNYKIRKITSSLGVAKNTVSDFALKAYPNPVSSVLNLQLANDMTIDGITIIDVTGKMLSHQSSNFNCVNVEHLAPGAYFVQAFSGDKKWQTKFIKE